MSVIMHYCICDKGLNCPLTQSALKLQELVKEINWKLIMQQVDYTECNSENELDEIEKSRKSLQSIVEELEK